MRHSWEITTSFTPWVTHGMSKTSYQEIELYTVRFYAAKVIPNVTSLSYLYSCPVCIRMESSSQTSWLRHSKWNTPAGLPQTRWHCSSQSATFKSRQLLPILCWCSTH